MEILNQYIQFIKDHPDYEKHLALERCEAVANAERMDLYTEIRVRNHELFFTYDQCLEVLYIAYHLQDGSDRVHSLNCFGQFYSMFSDYYHENKEIIYKRDLSTEEALFQLSTVRDVDITVDDYQLLEKFISDIKRVSKVLYGITY